MTDKRPLLANDSKSNHAVWPYRLISASAYLVILLVGLGLATIINWRYQAGEQSELALEVDQYREQSDADQRVVVADVEKLFREVYRSLRTVARLPGIRQLDPNNDQSINFHGGEGIQANARIVVQEIYNNLAFLVDISELYIVPINIDPDTDGSDPKTPREPLATFDQLVLDRNVQLGLKPYDFELEIEEYRLMRRQLAWLKEHYPREGDFKGLNYPGISGPEVVTCDIAPHTPSTPNNRSRMGLVFSVPYYGEDGALRGCVSGVLLTHVLSQLLPSGDYSIVNPTYGYEAPPLEDGQWQASKAYAADAKPAPGLLYSQVLPLNSHDLGGQWSVWAGHPDSMFWDRSDVRASIKARDIDYELTLAFTLGSLLGVWLVLRRHKGLSLAKVSLEKRVRGQTCDLDKASRENEWWRYTLDEHTIVSVTDIKGNITYANDKFCEISGYTREELIGQNHRIIRSDEHSREFFREMWKTISKGSVWHGEIKNTAKDGSHYWVNATIAPLVNVDGSINQYMAIRTDITSLKNIERRYSHAICGSRDGLWDWDLTTNRIYYSPRWKELLGADVDGVGDSPDDWINRIDPRDIQTFKHELANHLQGTTGVFETKMRMIHSDGRTLWVHCRGEVVRDNIGRAVRVVGLLADITEIRHAQTEFQKLAEHDHLTDLPNRKVFNTLLQQAIDTTEGEPGCKFAVLFFDFDRFKVINDGLGHNVGDALLIDIARHFESVLRHGDIAARFGGDEFVVLLNDLADYKEAIQTADRLLETFAKPHDLLGHSVTSTASVGLVTNAQGYTSANDMIRDADTAMYQAKEAGKARVIVFNQAMRDQAVDRSLLESDMRIALEGDQFRLVYQPIVELDSGQVTGFEALLRWDHPNRGTINPAGFIPIAEDTGLILGIGRWVLDTAARQLADWNHRLGLDQCLSMNVNITKRQLLSSSVLDDVNKCRRRYNLQPGDLKLEVTESTIADDRCDVVPPLREIREHGFPIVMDDFGTGVSSLSALHDYPIDVLKIDQSFIRILDRDRSLLAVVASITSLAENLGILTVAEGIETQDIVGALQSIDCTWGQGYLFAKPLNAAEAETYILDTCKMKRSA